MSERIVTLNEYQDAAMVTAKFNLDLGHLYPALGLAGESGEAVEKVLLEVFPSGPAGAVEARIFDSLLDLVDAAKECERTKKLLRDCRDDLPQDQLAALGVKVAKARGPVALRDPEKAKELGDALWYLSVLAKNLGWDLQEVAELNITKLRDRAARKKLHGSGDNR